jgi:hypothetical protein
LVPSEHRIGMFHDWVGRRIDPTSDTHTGRRPHEGPAGVLRGRPVGPAGIDRPQRALLFTRLVSRGDRRTRSRARARNKIRIANPPSLM